jgi:hypothetical protein
MFLIPNFYLFLLDVALQALLLQKYLTQKTTMKNVIFIQLELYFFSCKNYYFQCLD